MNSPPVTRKLASILAADAFGYSRMMSQDEEDTLRILAGHRTVIDGIIQSRQGRIFNTAGDSVLAEFVSPVEAVRCASEIQEALKTRNEELPESRRMFFRIGVNLGDVVVSGDDILGDGVNVAARLESIAEPGGICISNSVYEQIAGKLNLGILDLGEQDLKNISRPVRVYRLTTSSAPLRTAARKRPRPTLSFKLAGAAIVLVAAIGAWFALGPGFRLSDGSSYDGLWVVEQSCTAVNELKPFTHRYGVTITNGEVVIERGTPGDLRYMQARGKITNDGVLDLFGNVISPSKLTLGKMVPVRSSGRFVGDRYEGTGNMGGRACTFTFTRDQR